MSYDNSPLLVERSERGFWVRAQQLDQAKSNLGISYVLGQSGVAVPLTGTLAETTLASVPLPGGLMGRNGWLRVTSFWSFTNSANNKTMRARLAGQAIGGYTATANALLRMSNILANRGVENSQILPTGNVSFFDGITTGAAGTFAVDTSQDQVLALSGQLANVGETITLEMWMVEVFPC